MHSTCSDGSDSPTELAARVVAAGLRAAALTDHDNTAGHAEYRAALEAAGVEFVPGCEISCLHEGSSTHVLCYFLDDDPSSPLQVTLAGLQRDRETRNAKLVERLHELGYLRIDPARIEAIAGKPLAEAGRPHFAEALMEAYPEGGEAPEVDGDLPTSFASIQDVFNGLLANNGPAYIAKAHLTVEQATEQATASGAVTVLAHPILSFCKSGPEGPPSLEQQRARLDEVFAEMAAVGVSGAEAYYSRNSPEQTEMLLDLCERHGLVPTGGSDHHGSKKPDLDVGIGVVANRGTPSELRVPDDVLEQLRARRPAS